MLPSWIRSRNCRPRLVYFLAMEITRRRLASIISFLASRDEASPSFMRLLMSLSSASGTTTRDCRSASFCCSSWIGGMLRAMIDAPGLAGGGLLLDPLLVQQVGREVLDEGFLRHAALVHDDAAQLALLLAHVVDLAAHHVAQLLDGLGREADGHQLFGQGRLRLDVGGRALAFLVVDLVDLLEQAVRCGRSAPAPGPSALRASWSAPWSRPCRRRRRRRRTRRSLPRPRSRRPRWGWRSRRRRWR